MVKLRIISDIHFTDGINNSDGKTIEHTPFGHYFHKPLKEQQDCVTLIAGDMATSLEETDKFLNGFFPNQQVIFIEGNHLVYQRTMKTIFELKDELKEKYPLEHLLWHYLEDDWMWIPNTNNEVAIIGSTFYTDYEYTHLTLDEYNEIEKKYHNIANIFGYGDGSEYIPEKELTKDLIIRHNMFNAQESLNDFRWGWETPSRKISPQLYRELHLKSKEKIKRCYDEIIRINPNAKIILMTHHCLSPQCIDEKYKNHKANASYVSDLENWIKQFNNLKLIISGHVHCGKDFMIGDKRYVVNACGYIAYQEAHRKNGKFNPNFIIDTDDL